MKQKHPTPQTSNETALRQLAYELSQLRDAMNALSLAMQDRLFDESQREMRVPTAEWQELIARLRST